MPEKSPAFPHEMLREIYEQPAALRRTLALYLQLSHAGAPNQTHAGAPGPSHLGTWESTTLQTNAAHLNPEVAASLARWANPAGEVLIAASGSSRHSGLAAEILLEDLCGLAVDVEYASEYSTRGGVALRHPSVIVISQSGETSDTLAALREVKARGDKVLAITNAASSTMAREADVSMPLAAGVEKAIPATKSFTCQLEVLFLSPSSRRSAPAAWTPPRSPQTLAASVPCPTQSSLSSTAGAIRLRRSPISISDANTFLFLGRGIHYAIAREGALKLKEASYVHAEGYPVGELKHGPNALVSDTVPLVVIATVDRTLPDSVMRYEKTLQLLADMKAQGARVIAIANHGDSQVADLVSDCVEVQPASEYLLPIAEVVPLQLFAYYMAIEHGVDVDRPRNLSKAVVEK
jgi:glucosamine--fructose-6-phosphate aminotransferase (isomerizing)